MTVGPLVDGNGATGPRCPHGTKDRGVVRYGAGDPSRGSDERLRVGPLPVDVAGVDCGLHDGEEIARCGAGWDIDGDEACAVSLTQEVGRDDGGLDLVSGLLEIGGR